MREIKFKYWDNEEKVMMGPNLDPERYRIVTYDGLALFDNEREDEDGYEYQMDVVFLQWTGLNDSKGTLIYEGDIVELECDCDPGDYAICTHEPWKGYVDWEPETASFELRDLKGKWSSEAFEDGTEDSLLVVGNIYENSDLLDKNE